ncbi:unnamed protein product, partial [Ectocarpus sp. 4 AP-2014]
LLGGGSCTVLHNGALLSGRRATMVVGCVACQSVDSPTPLQAARPIACGSQQSNFTPTQPAEGWENKQNYRSAQQPQTHPSARPNTMPSLFLFANVLPQQLEYPLSPTPTASKHRRPILQSLTPRTSCPKPSTVRNKQQRSQDIHITTHLIAVANLGGGD